MPTLRQLRVEAKWRGLEIQVVILPGFRPGYSRITWTEYAIWSPSTRAYLLRISFVQNRTVAYAALMGAISTAPLTKEGAMSRAVSAIRRDIRIRRRVRRRHA